MTSGIVWSGMHVAITGKLPIPRSEAIIMLENAAAIYSPRVTRRTDVLLVSHIRSATGMTRKLFMQKTSFNRTCNLLV